MLKRKRDKLGSLQEVELGGKANPERVAKLVTFMVKFVVLVLPSFYVMSATEKSFDL